MLIYEKNKKRKQFILINIFLLLFLQKISIIRNLKVLRVYRQKHFIPVVKPILVVTRPASPTHKLIFQHNIRTLAILQATMNILMFSYLLDVNQDK